MKMRGVFWLLPMPLVAAAAIPLAAPAKRSDFCTERGARTVLRSDEARVYSVPVSRKKHAARQKVACLYATNTREYLDDGDFLVTYGPPGMALRGHLLAYGQWLGPDGDFAAETVVELLDLRRTESGGDGFARLVDTRASGHAEVARIGSMRISGRRVVVWIACPDADDYQDPTPKAAPGCVRPGRPDEVRAAVPSGDGVKVVTLARSRRVDPRSLRVRRSRASWVERGRRRSAALPKP